MKRILTAALLLLTICLLTACAAKSGNTSPDTLEGRYRLIDVFGKDSNAVYKARDGVDLEIRADNTGTLSMMTDVHELHFDPAQKICTSNDDQKVDYTFDGKELVLETDTFTMVFERQ